METWEKKMFAELWFFTSITTSKSTTVIFCYILYWRALRASSLALSANFAKAKLLTYGCHEHAMEIRWQYSWGCSALIAITDLLFALTHRHTHIHAYTHTRCTDISHIDANDVIVLQCFFTLLNFSDRMIKRFTSDFVVQLRAVVVFIESRCERYTFFFSATRIEYYIHKS